MWSLVVLNYYIGYSDALFYSIKSFRNLFQYVILVFLFSPSLFYLLVHRRCWVFLWFHFITLKHTPQSLGLLWTRNRPVTEICTWQHKHCTRQTSMPSCGIRTHDPSKRSAVDLRLRPRGHWDRPLLLLFWNKISLVEWMFLGVFFSVF
jgi:hypothetical protein